MNSKGFTIVELLFTIAILGLVIAIAIPSYMGVSNLISNSARNNVIKEIELAASKYAFDTGENLIFVDRLITEGYLDSDDEEGNVIDPLNNVRMNCYIVEMNKVSDYYDATFIDGNNYDLGNTCDSSKLNQFSEHITLLVNDKVYSNNEWLSGDVRIQAISENTVNINCDLNKCLWRSSGGFSAEGKDYIEIKGIYGVLNSSYTFQYTEIEEETNEIKRYNANVSIKIDNEVPFVNQNQITISDKFILTPSKKVEIIANDGSGSGIAGYYLGKGEVICDSSNILNNYQTHNSFSVRENGNYIACVKDKVGNISTIKDINIEFIN